MITVIFDLQILLLHVCDLESLALRVLRLQSLVLCHLSLAVILGPKYLLTSLGTTASFSFCLTCLVFWLDVTHEGAPLAFAGVDLLQAECPANSVRALKAWWHRRGQLLPAVPFPPPAVAS